MTVSPSAFLASPLFLSQRSSRSAHLHYAKSTSILIYAKLHQVPFARRRGELDVQIDFARSNQPTELSKKPVSAELIRAKFDKPPDADFFTLPFPTDPGGPMEAALSRCGQVFKVPNT